MEMAFGNTIIHIEHFLTFNIRKIRYSIKKTSFAKTYIYDLLIEQRDGDNKLLLHESFLFSDNNSIILTYDEVLKTLELGQK